MTNPPEITEGDIIAFFTAKVKAHPLSAKVPTLWASCATYPFSKPFTVYATTLPNFEMFNATGASIDEACTVLERILENQNKIAELKAQIEVLKNGKEAA